MPPRFCLCNCCGKLHSNCPFEMSLVEDIIYEVRKRPELWLSKHPKFRNTTLKGKLWSAIAAKLNIDGFTLKKHWKYLKGQFKKEMTKPSARSSDDGEEQVSYLQYLDQLSFLREEFEERPANLPMTIVREEVISSDLPMSFMRETVENVHPFGDLPNHHLQETTEAQSILTHIQDMEDNNSTLPTAPLASISPKTRLSVDSQSKNSMKSEFTRSHIMMSEVGETKDEDFFYLMSILPSMKRLTNVQKMRFRSKIEQFLLEAVSINEYSSYMNNFSPNNSLPAQGNRKRKCRKTRS